VSDAHRLLDHLAGTPAHVLGGSSGAIIALALLARHPDQVRTLVAHEPPLASVLPDAAQWLEFYAGVYATYKRAGAKAAMEIFRARMGMNSPTLPPPSAQLPPRQLAEMLDRIRGNQPGWYENEIRTYPAFVLDIAALKPVSDRLILAGGSTSRADFPYRPNEVLADRVGTEIVDFPGGHVGYVTHPVEFADMLTRVLSARDN
jgi:pimeloyl-ACP methyl ester carboxylesterase